MHSGNTHIISKFRWQTLFDSKEYAFSLQERLSDWSRIYLEREAARVFDQLCPTDQIWKIGLLELDLGAIDFHNLEADLTEKINKCLKAALIDQIIYSGNSNSNIDISTREVSSLTILQNYFLSGILPWNSRTDDISVNEMLSEQFSNHSRSLADWLMELGEASLVVRKRMAMQISEPNLICILKILEPTNHRQILDFTNELTRLQEKETIVQAGSKDFRKHLWLWTFNFLFTERGSVFNRKAYLKSSIRQIADHYNIAYDSLFEIMGEAVKKVTTHLSTHADLIIILQELTIEYSAGVSMDITQDLEIDYWFILEQLLKGNSVLGYSPMEFIDEFIISLSRKDNHRFSQLIQSLQLTQNSWLVIAGLLSDNSLERILYAYNPGRAGFIIECIQFLTKLCKEQNIIAQPNLLWVTGIRNLRQHKNEAGANRLFMMDCVLSLGKSNGLSWEKMLLQLVGSPIPMQCKTGKSLDVFATIGEIFLEEIGNRPPTFFNNRFIELVDSYYDHLDHNKMDTEKMVSVQLSLRKYMQLYPSVALELLVQHSGKDKFSKLFDHLIDNHLAALLLEHAAAGSYYSLLASIIKQFKKFGGNQYPGQLSHFIENYLMLIGLRLVVISPELDRNQFSEKLFEELFSVLPSSLHQQFRKFILRLVSGESPQVLGLPSNSVEKIANILAPDAEDSVLERMKNLMIQGTQNREEVSKLLRANFRNAGFVALRRSNGSDSVALANYLLEGAGNNMNQWTEEYIKNQEIQKISISVEVLIENIREIFWKCLLDSKSHLGSLVKYKIAFTKSIEFRFLSEDKFLQPFKSEHPVQHELPGLIRQCFENCESSILFHDTNTSLRDLIGLAMETAPRMLAQILSHLAYSDKQVELALSVINFQELSTCIIELGKEAMSEGIDDMSFLLYLVNSLGIESSEGSWETKKIREAITLLSKGSWAFENIVPEILINAISANKVIQAIKDIGYLPSPGLQSILIKQMPVLEKDLPELPNKAKRNRIQQLIRKGILDQLIESLFIQQQVPFWFSSDDKEEAGILLTDIINYYPLYVKRAIKKETITDSQFRWFAMSIDTKRLFQAFKRLYSGKTLLIDDLSVFYGALENISLKGIPGYELQALFFRKIIHVWTTEDWKALSATHIWNTLAWECILQTGLTKNNFLSGIEPYKLRFPVSLQVSFEQFKESLNEVPVFKRSIPTSKKLQKPRFNTVNEPGIGEGIAIKNAGLVILNSYIPLLFERMELTRDGEFIHPTAQNDAVHYLQYLVTGADATEEFLLPLNKILCGMDLAVPVTEGIALRIDQEQMMESLIHGLISHWPDAGSHTVDGLRGNWLVRNGILRKEENGWELTVERKAYDLLLMRAPFSFSLIKFPWMEKPLTVKWRL